MRLSDRAISQLPAWLFNHTLIMGAEGETKTDLPPAGTGTDESTEDDDGDDDDDDDDKVDGEQKVTKTEKVAMVPKEVLRKERLARRALAKELKELKAKMPAEPPEGDPAKDDADGKAAKETAEATRKAAEEARAAEEKSVKLSLKFRENAVDSAIVKALNDPGLLKTIKGKFADPDDVLKLINRKDIDVDQDDDDPSEVEVDGDDIMEALKTLAKKKPHLLAKSDDEGDDEGRTPGSGNGKGKRGNGSSEEALRSKYPALNRR